MKNDYFENKIVTKMCAIMRAQKAAVNLGEDVTAKEIGAKYDGFMDALHCTLSGSYIAHLVSLANEIIEAEG